MNYSCKTVFWHGPLTEDLELDKLSARYKCAPTFTCKDYTKKVAGIDKQHHISSMNYSCKTVLYHGLIGDDLERDKLSARHRYAPSFTCPYQTREKWLQIQAAPAKWYELQL